jgi:Ser/Thr protein kinase RdoA (MazF antagonist)
MGEADVQLVAVVADRGVFHADPHPANVLLLTDGRLALLDFGSVGRLDAQQRAALLNLLSADRRVCGGRRSAGADAQGLRAMAL